MTLPAPPPGYLGIEGCAAEDELILAFTSPGPPRSRITFRLPPGDAAALRKLLAPDRGGGEESDFVAYVRGTITLERGIK